jgi:putative transposase
VVKKHVANTSELEDKIIAMYAKGMSVRDIQETLKELYGVDVTPTTLSAITDKVWELVEVRQNRPLASTYPIIYLDAIHIKLRREGKVETTAVYTVLGVDLDGHRDVLGHWLGEGSETANFWLSVVTDLQARWGPGYLHCLHGWTERIQGCRPGGFSPDPDPALHHSSNSQQPEIRDLDGSQAFHGGFTPGLPSCHS